MDYVHLGEQILLWLFILDMFFIAYLKLWVGPRMMRRARKVTFGDTPAPPFRMASKWGTGKNNDPKTN